MSSCGANVLVGHPHRSAPAGPSIKHRPIWLNLLAWPAPRVNTYAGLRHRGFSRCCCSRHRDDRRHKEAGFIWEVPQLRLKV